MKIHFGLGLDGPSFPQFTGEKEAVIGELTCGPLRLLAQLELRLGLTGAWEPAPYRTELYRQRLLGADNKSRFYHRSLKADSLAVAETLLCWRDSLRLGGWDFTAGGDTPRRLKDLSEVEKFGNGAMVSLPLGIADRVRTVMDRLPNPRLNIANIRLAEVRTSYGPPWDNFIDLLAQSGVTISDPPAPAVKGKGDLGSLQKSLLTGGSANVSGDGSLVVLGADSDSIAADTLVQWLASEADAKRVLILPPGDLTLSRILAMNGQPNPGVAIYSTQRPVLQILPLLFELVWDPLDPYRLLEFLTLPVSPIPRWVGEKLSKAVAEAPGIGGPVWKNVLEEIGAVAKLKNSSGGFSSPDSGIRELVRRWLEGPRFSVTTGVSSEAVSELARRIAQWAGSRSSGDEAMERQFKSLAAQASHLAGIVDALPEERINPPQLQRLIRMVQGDGQSVGEEGQAGHLSWVASPEAIVGPVDDLVWWGFTSRNSPSIPRPPWSRAEKLYLSGRGVRVEDPVRIAERFSAGFQRAVIAARNRLVLVVPERERGEETNPHPFHDRLRAILGDDLVKVELSVAKWLLGHQMLPSIPTVCVSPRSVPSPKRIWRLRDGESMTAREEESYSSLDVLLHAPFKWALRYKARLHEAPIVSVRDGNELLGILLHRLFQKIFLPGETFKAWRRPETDRKVDEAMEQLLAEEGAVLLLPGREAERTSLARKAREAVWTMVGHVRDNGWRVSGTEFQVEGKLKDQAIQGKIDLLLEKEDGTLAVVDMKWGGRKYRRTELAENRALQLTIYTRMLKKKGETPHCGYFILSDAVILASDNEAFRNAYVISPPDGETPETLWRCVEKTWEWRRSQFARGVIEVPVEGTEADPGILIPEGCLVTEEDTRAPDEFQVLVGWAEGDHA
jgi:RecB family exonuclease